MRFLLDNDVDATLVGLLHRNGHEAFTAAEIGLAGVDAAEDDAVSVAAQERDAAVVTHDRAFTRRRRRQTFGRHVFLGCDQPDALEVVEEHLDKAVEYLEAREDVVLRVSRNGVKLYKPRWE